MAQSPFERPATRRRFVIDTLHGALGAVWAAACGASTGGFEPTQADEHGGANNGGAGNGGANDGGANSGGGDAGDGSAAGAVDGGTGGGTVGNGGTGGSGGAGGSGGGPDTTVCALYPQETEGPYYLDLGLLRSDITEGKPGAPLELEIEVVRARDCSPVADAAVDVWHCDAAGVYSGFPGQLGGLDTTGERALRGTQITGADGRVTFRTIYPGWYPGRTTHVHFKVHLTPTSVVTSQLYFPEDVTAEVYTTAPYDAHGGKDTTNAADATAHTGGMPPLLASTKTPAGFAAKLRVTVLG
ncbi:MAG TPA: intradiol ring-cleavage dioxygenase [Polyangiaceae bacterium]|nr:intradiol ring-cleavage dioxygenase [Polyangiaceae bacterium]